MPRGITSRLLPVGADSVTAESALAPLWLLLSLQLQRATANDDKIACLLTFVNVPRGR